MLFSKLFIRVRAEEVGDGEAEGVGEFFDVVDGDIGLSLFAGHGWANAAGAGMRRSGAIWLM